MIKVIHNAEKVAVCSKCCGTGVMKGGGACTVCCGSGRVIVKSDVRMVIRAYVPGDV